MKKSNLLVLIGVAVLIALGTAYWVKKANDDEAIDREKQRRRELQLFAIEYYSFEAASGTGAGPDNLDEMLKIRSISAQFQTQIRNGSFVVVWSVVFDAIPKGIPSNRYYLGFEKDTPTHGGWVIRLDGTADRISAEEFSKLSLPRTIHKPEDIADGSGWKRYYSTDNKSSAAFPGKPERRQIHHAGNFPFREGGPIEFGPIVAHELELPRKPKGEYYLRNFPATGKGDAETFFDEMRAKQLAVKEDDGNKYSLIAENPIELKDSHVKGREFQFADERDEVIFVRFFVFDGRVYRASVAGPRPKMEDPDIRRFLESVRFHAAK